MMKKNGLMVIWMLLTVFSAFAKGEVSVSNLRSWVAYLASEDLEGRLSISPGAHKAADFIAEKFEEWGLEAKGSKGFFQDFEMTIGTMPGETNALAFQAKNSAQQTIDAKQIRPLGLSLNKSAEGIAVFAGYGLSLPDKGYDDYASIEVKDKIVIVFRGAPDFIENANQFASVRRKAQTALEKGAVGLIVVNLPDNNRLLPLQGGGRGGMLPALNITKEAGDKIFATVNTTVATVAEKIKSNKKPVSASLDINIKMTSEVKPRKGNARNVIGFLPGSDPKLKEEVIVIGAHYDHLGYGEVGSLAPDSGGIHYGADDNASGTAGLMELARLFSLERKGLKRSLLFIAFSGEEEGLVGAGFFTRNPTVPMDKITAMINMDMIGRLKDNNLQIGGINSSPDWQAIIDKVNTDGFKVSEERTGGGSSDHAVFFARGIPILFFFTGLHEDYHRPTDTPDKINYEGQARIVQFGYRLIKLVNERADRIKFESSRPSGGGGTGPRGVGGARVRLGLMPDYTDDGQGVRITGVMPNSPAEKAGVKAGDRVIEIAGVKVKDVEEMTAQYANMKAGEPVKIKIMRDGKEMELTLIPQAVEQ